MCSNDNAINVLNVLGGKKSWDSQTSSSGIVNSGKARSLHSEQAGIDLCTTCHSFTLHVRAWGKLKRLCVLVD